MDTIGSPQVYGNTTHIVVLGASKLSNDAMINYDSVLSRMLIYSTGVKVEAGLPLF